MTPDAAKDILLARRAELLGNLERIEDQLDDPMPKDWEDAASERQGDEVLTALGQSDRAEIRRIDAALARIAAEHTYALRGAQVDAIFRAHGKGATIQRASA